MIAGFFYMWIAFNFAGFLMAFLLTTASILERRNFNLDPMQCIDFKLPMTYFVIGSVIGHYFARLLMLDFKKNKHIDQIIDDLMEENKDLMIDLQKLEDKEKLKSMRVECNVEWHASHLNIDPVYPMCIDGSFIEWDGLIGKRGRLIFEEQNRFSDELKR